MHSHKFLKASLFYNIMRLLNVIAFSFFEYLNDPNGLLDILSVILFVTERRTLEEISYPKKVTTFCLVYNEKPD